jgi:hypothetical protein
VVQDRNPAQIHRLEGVAGRGIKPFDRKGRATASFTRAKVGGPWVASHTHMSLFRGTPDVSHGMKPSKS